MILEGILQDDLYVAKTLINKAIPQEKDIEYWHRVIGHVGQKKLLKVLDHEGIKVTDKVLPKCTACLKGKMKRKPFHKNKDSREFKKGEYLHMDLMGPITPTARNELKYILAVIDVNVSGRHIRPQFPKPETGGT